MYVHTDVPEVPWYVVDADDKKRARLNCIAHLLSEDPVRRGSRSRRSRFRNASVTTATSAPPRDLYTYVPDHADELANELAGRTTAEKPSRRLTRLAHCTRSSSASATVLRIPVTNGISSFV